MLTEKIIELVSAHGYKPSTVDQMGSSMGLDRNGMKELRKVVNELVEEGRLFLIKRDRVVLPERFGIFVGRLDANKRGFGFVPQGEGLRDIFVPENAMNQAMNGDKVMVKVVRRDQGDRRAEGEVIRILERRNQKIVGIYQESKNYGFVVPEDGKLKHDIFISKKNRNFAENEDVVVVEVTRWPEKGRNPEGLITEILGKQGDKGVDILTLVKKYDLPEEFSSKVMQYVDNLPETIPDGEIARRRDLRGMPIMTIDGSDSKDLDDAVTVEKLSDGTFKLGVHIADVTHYVRERSPLDVEALKRATSIYLIDVVIPMLPQKLSNELCSLNPDEPKLTLSCEMIIDGEGKVQKHEIFESIMVSSLRATYEDVTRVLHGEMEESLKKYEPYLEMLKAMEELQGVLEAKRKRRGSLDFEIPESKIKLDKLGKPIEISKYPREISNRIIEEFMLVCNETVAEHMFWTHVPFVYRVHEEPDTEKLKAFTEFSFNLGYPVRTYSSVQPKALQEVLDSVKGKNEEPVLSKLLLRSMMQAKYGTENIGHFGLAATYYTHFTSPIRRYPDLMIHRIIKDYINGRIDEKRVQQLLPLVAEAAKQSSEMERYAVEAERELDALKKSEFMYHHVGEEFDGIISSVTNFGLFVELPNTIEGLVHITTMYDDYYVYDERFMTLEGEQTKKKYALGDKIRILVSRVDVDAREIFFEIKNGGE